MEAKFEAAKKTLTGKALIGIVDRYDESMIVMENELREIFPQIDLSYIRQNITDDKIHQGVEEKAQQVVKSLPDEMGQKLLAENQMDAELYEMAHRLLDRKIDEMHEADPRLHEFKERCQQLAKE